MSEVKIPEGYKQTEVGVIPKDWDLLPAKEMTSFIGGYSFSSNSAQNNGIRWVKIANVGVNKVKWDAKSYLPYSFAEMHSKYLLKENDVVIALTRPILSESLKIARLSLSDTPSLLNQRVAKLEVTSKGDTNFAYYVLQTSSFVAAMNLAMAGTDPPNIGTKALSKIQVLIPPKQEQTAIATALSDVDSLIQSIEKLIAKKEAIKTGAMQQLLTGKTRLPEFSTREDGSTKGFKQTELGQIPEDWDVVNFDELLEPTISKKPINPSTLVTFVGMQDVTGNAQLANQTIVSYEKLKSGFTYFENGDVLLAKITPCFENGKGCHTETLKTKYGFGSTEFHVLRATEYSDSKFIYFWTTRNSFRIDLESTMVGSAGHRRVPLSAVKSYQIPCPTSKSEQTAIATILSDMDAEIQSFHQRLEKIKDIKQGMMQQLLTGKVRLAH